MVNMKKLKQAIKIAEQVKLLGYNAYLRVPFTTWDSDIGITIHNVEDLTLIAEAFECEITKVQGSAETEINGFRTDIFPKGESFVHCKVVKETIHVPEKTIPAHDETKTTIIC